MILLAMFRIINGSIVAAEVPFRKTIDGNLPDVFEHRKIIS